MAESAANSCPVQGCDSLGHINPAYSRHCTVYGCPLYHSGAGTPREPNLSQVPLQCQQSLRLFREAQSLLTEDPEQELLMHWQLVPGEYQVDQVVLGSVQMDTWYKSSLPQQLSCLPRLYFCEFCLNVFRQEVQLQRHSAKCPYRHPPGCEIYRQGDLSLFEVDGKHFRPYCQSLCRLAKFFINHKTLVEGVEAFVFYVLTEADETGCRLIGYFSKEKRSLLNYNLSCLLVLPHHMRKGYGFLLIDLSYLLSSREGSIGSPEKPLSDAGLMTYRKYWTRVILTQLGNHHGAEISIRELSQETKIHPNDIVSTLLSLELVKYWRGQHYILADRQRVRERLAVSLRTYMRTADPRCLTWRPSAADPLFDQCQQDHV